MQLLVAFPVTYLVAFPVTYLVAFPVTSDNGPFTCVSAVVLVAFSVSSLGPFTCVSAVVLVKFPVTSLMIMMSYHYCFIMN